MIRIYCTKKLQKFIGTVETDLPADTVHRSILDWNAHLFFVDKRKCIVFVNNLTYYSFFIKDILKKDLENIENLFYDRLRKQLLNDQIINNESLEPLLRSKRLMFYKTNNDRKTIGRINDFVYMFKIYCYEKYDHLNNMDVVYENGLLNTTPVGKPGENKKTWSSPIENMNEFKTSAQQSVCRQGGNTV